MTLLLEVTEYRDAAHWRWRLTEEGGAFIADHQVALDVSAVEYQGFVDLHAFLQQRADPGNRLASEAELVDRVGGWLGKWALGPIGPELAARSPVTVRVRVPAGAEAPLQRLFELANVDGRPLALQNVSLVFDPADGVPGGRAPMGERLRMLEGWARGTLASPGEASLTLFGFLCGLEEADRLHLIVRQVWGDLRRRLRREEEEPDLERALGPLVERALVEVVAEGEDPDRRVYRLHPAIVEVGRAEAEAGLQAAVDRKLAAYWGAWFEHGRRQPGGEAGGLVVGSARRAMPYLVRLQEWDAARYMIQEVIGRDQSPATLAALLPTLRGIVEATRGTGAELAATAVLARALQRYRPEEAEALLHEVIERALAAGDYAVASAAAGDLVNLLRDGERLREALWEVERKATFTAHAGLGPWRQLADQGLRLQILSMLGRQDEVLHEIGRLRDQMAGLPEQPGPNEQVWTWNVRETLLDTGFHAARDLGRQQEALAFLDEQVQSKRRRGAGRLEVARTRFNAYGSLIRLGRLVEAHELLLESQQVFSQENDLLALGKVLGARAELEDELGRQAEAVELVERALPYSYLAGDVAAIAVSHSNLANYLGRADRRPDALPHRLAAALIRFQTESVELALTLTALGRELAETAALTSFAEVCAAVEQVEGVRFRELFAALPQRAASPDDALAQVLALARHAQ